MRRTLAALVMMGLALGAMGCGGGKGAATTPEGTAKAFLAAVQAGDALGVAMLYDYVESAQGQNENWGEIPKGQQDLILKKLAESAAVGMKADMGKLAEQWKDGKVGTAQVNGETATVAVETAQGSQTLKLVQRGEKWYIMGGVAG